MATAKRDDKSQDKTRRHPAGSRTETKIANESELGSDMQTHDMALEEDRARHSPGDDEDSR
jgi:hypothetical protein